MSHTPSINFHGQMPPTRLGNAELGPHIPRQQQSPWTPSGGSTDPAVGPDAFFSNIEQILVPDGHVTYDLAKKVGEITERFLWFGHDVTVLPQQPDPDFLDYVRSFGLSPNPVVPSNIDIKRLALREGTSDPAVQEALQDRWVESYIGDRALYLALHGLGLGIRYANGDPGDSIRAVNHKGNFADFAEGLVDIPPGGLFTGIENIADATLQRIIDEGAAFVRLAESGGGLGNRLFRASELGGKSRSEALAYIRDKLNGSRPDLWENGDALVERALELGSSPSSNFNTLNDTVVDGHQIMHNNDCWGFWLPAPSWRYDTGRIRDIGRGVRDRVKQSPINFWGRGSVDLGIASAKSMDADEPVMVGFEVNGRSTAQRHVMAVANLLWGPYDDWSKDGRAIKALDHFELSKTYTFKGMHDRLAKAGMLASLENPFGVVITIPPQHGIAGIQVMGQSYEHAETVYRQLVDLVGDPTTNTEDHPLFDQEMSRI